MKKFDRIIKIEGKTASSEIKALVELLPIEVAFAHLEWYFINGPGWEVLKNLKYDQSLYSKINTFADKLYLELVREYEYHRGPMSVNIIMDPILAALEGANYHKELSTLNKSHYHWSDRLKHCMGDFSFQTELDKIRLKVEDMPLMLVKFNEEFLKLC